MKLKEYIKKLQAIEKEHGNLDVIYAIDDEGNGFRKSYYSPTIGDFIDNEEYIQSESEDWDEDNKINCICIN